MADGKDSSSNTKTDTPNKPYIHPAYSVTNIQTKIRTLDGKNTTYSSWVKLFKLHLKAYKLLHHIDGTPPPAKTDPTYAEWSELDALILQWIFGTISDEILDRVLENDIPARDAWTEIEAVFLSNKKARAAALLHEFTHTTLKDYASMDAYCQKLKDLSRQLADVGKPVDESSLIIQLVNGLPKELDMIGTIINTGTPTWNEARTIIDLEMRRISARNELSTGTHGDSVLYTAQGQQKSEAPNANTGSGKTYPGSNYRGNNYDPNFNLRMGRGARGNRGRGGRNQTYNPRNNTNYPTSYQNNSSQQNHNNSRPNSTFTPSHNHYSSQQTTFPSHPTNSQFGHVPPSPYPSAPSHQISYTPAHIQQPPNQVHFAGPTQPAPAQTFNGLNPSDIGAALSNMQLNYRDPYWYMDTGASSHLTSDSGPQGWTPPFPSQ